MYIYREIAAADEYMLEEKKFSQSTRGSIPKSNTYILLTLQNYICFCTKRRK